MAIYRIKRLFSKKEEENAIKSGAAAVGATGILATTKTGRLTGKVVRYHNTENGNVKSIMENGILSRYSTDPNNLTNQVLKNVDMKDKEGLVYTSKRKSIADNVGMTREMRKHPSRLFGPTLKDLENWKKTNKTLKLEFEYDQVKGSEKVANPELLGAKSLKEYKKKFYEAHPEIKKSKIVDFQLRSAYKSLGEKGTHVFKGDIKPENIVGGKGYKKRGAKQILKYIKNNPGRFGKEAAKVGVGVGLGGYAIKKAVDNLKQE